MKIIEVLEKGNEFKDFSLINHILVKGDVGHQNIVLTIELMTSLVNETHTIFGHIGSRKCVSMISESFYYPDLKEKASRILRTCDSCQRNKIYTASTFGKSSPILPTGPRDLISIDFCGPLPTSRGGVKHILVVLDVFLKFVVMYAIKKADTKTSIRKIFDFFIPVHGKPKRIQSDQGTQFTSKLWLERLTLEGIQPVFSAIRHPQSNAVE